MLGNRHSQHSFAMIPSVNQARSQFDRSFGVKDAFDFDYLIPIYVDEVLPGDTFNLSVRAFARLATQLVPIMDNMYLDFFFFFVPNRLTYEKWEKMMGAQDNPADTIDYVCPQLTSTAGTGFPVDSIYDKFGLPIGIGSLLIKNTMPLRCYNRIWNDWFRDENLQNSVINNIDAGPDIQADYTLLKRGKRHDYFTSALPWPQKGTALSLPLGTTAPVQRVNATGNVKLYYDNNSIVNSATGLAVDASGNMEVSSGAFNLMIDPNGTLVANLATATAATINQLREAMLVQSLLELNARGGTRYVEILRSHFGVISPDFRLQRSEYLGGGTVPINVHAVPQTSATAGSEPQGQLAAFATASATSAQNIGFTKSFVEHGYVIGLACARADITYQQGLNKMWDRSTRYDFFWPKLQQLGEQSILNKEIYCDGSANDNLVFGYQERHAEYRYKPSEIHGQLRSQYATPLDMWHLAEEFGSLPALNATFIQQSTPVDRAIAVPSEPHLIFDAWFQLKCARPMMTYSTPATLGRF